MQGQAARAEERDHETKKTGQRREIFRRMSSGGAEKAKSLPLKIGHFHPHPLLADGGLPVGALQSRRIEPRKSEGRERKLPEEIPPQQGPLLRHRFLIELLPPAAQFEGQRSKREEDDDWRKKNGAIDEKRDEAGEKRGGG